MAGAGKAKRRAKIKPQWKNIAQHVNGRTHMKCRERFTHTLRRFVMKDGDGEDFAHGKWTAAEDKLLRAAVAKQGAGSWSDIAKLVKGQWRAVHGPRSGASLMCACGTGRRLVRSHALASLAILARANRVHDEFQASFPLINQIQIVCVRVCVCVVCVRVFVVSVTAFCCRPHRHAMLEALVTHEPGEEQQERASPGSN